MLATSYQTKESTAVLINERIVINVSGMYFETWSYTLNRFPNTLLGNPIKRKRFFDYVHNEYFFERHRQSFEAILFYYQSNGRFLNRPNTVSPETFFEEIVFFELGVDAIDKYKKDEGFLIDKQANIRDLPRNPVQRYIWMLFEQPQSSIFSRIIAIISVVIIIVSIALFCVETLPDVKNKRSASNSHHHISVMSSSSSSSISSSTALALINSQAAGSSNSRIIDEFFVIETVCTVWFTIELVMRFISAPNKLKFTKQLGNIIDLLSILPYFVETFTESSYKLSMLRIIRLVRVFRVFKLARHFKGLQILAHTFKSSANELLLLVFFLIVGVVLFSSFVYFVEMDHPKTFVISLPLSRSHF